MLRINLLPPYIFDKQKKVKLAIVWGVAAAAVIGLFMMWFGQVNGQLDDVKKQLAEATDYKNQWDSTDSQIKKVNDDVAVIRSKQTFIANAKTNNNSWPTVYEAMRDVTSPVILLESLAIEPVNHKALDFVGFAKDELTIARWWMSLRNAKDRFDSVTFNLPAHPYIPPVAANGTGGMNGMGGFGGSGMGGSGMRYPGMGGSGMGYPGMGGSGMGSGMRMPAAAGMSGMGGGGKMPMLAGGARGMGGFGGMGGGMGGASNGSSGPTEIEGRQGLNFTGVAMVKDTLAPPVAPVWPAGGGAAAGMGGMGGFSGMGGMPPGMSGMPPGMSGGMGGARMPAAAPAGGKGKKGMEGD